MLSSKPGVSSSVREQALARLHRLARRLYDLDPEQVRILGDQAEMLITLLEKIRSPD